MSTTAADRREGDLLAALALAGLGFAIAGLGPCVALLGKELDVSADRLAWLSSAFAIGLLIVAAVGVYVLRTDARMAVLRAGAVVCAGGAVLLAVAQGLVIALLGGLLIGLGGALMLLVVPLMLNGPDAAVRIARANAIASGLSILAPLIIGAVDAILPTGRLALLLTPPPLILLTYLCRTPPPIRHPADHTDNPAAHWAHPANHDSARPVDHDSPPAERRAPPAHHDGPPADHHARPAESWTLPAAESAGLRGGGVPNQRPAPYPTPLVVAFSRWSRVVLAVSVEFCFVIWAVARLVATGLPASTAAVLGSAFPLGMAVGRLIGPVRIGRLPALAPAVAVAAVGTLMVCATNSAVPVTIGLALAGLGVATLYPITVADLIGTPGVRPAQLASLSAFASGTAILVAPAVLAVLAGVVELRAAFLFALPLLALLLAVRVHHHDEPVVTDERCGRAS